METKLKSTLEREIVSAVCTVHIQKCPIAMVKLHRVSKTEHQVFQQCSENLNFIFLTSPIDNYEILRRRPGIYTLYINTYM